MDCLAPRLDDFRRCRCHYFSPRIGFESTLRTARRNRHVQATASLVQASRTELIGPSHQLLSKLPGFRGSMVGVNSDGGRPQNGARVLVVDDEPNITELLAMALRYEGFTVKTAATGRAAVTAVTQFSPALVILDVMLPDIASIEELMARVRVVLRRHGTAGADGGRLTLADLEMDDEAHEVRRGPHIVELTTT